VQLQQRFAACIQVTRIVNMAVPCQTLLTWLGSAAGEDVQLEMSHTRVCVCVIYLSSSSYYYYYLI